MNEQPTTQPKSNNINIIVIISLLVLAGVAAWLVFRVENLSGKVDSFVKTNTEAETDKGPNNNIQTTIQSGKSGFSVTVPNGWGPLLKPLDSDWLLMMGKEQPTLDANSKTEIRETSSMGTDSASLFTILLTDQDIMTPRGTAEEFTISKAEEALVGKKYTYIYPKDDLDGIGYLRLQNDRNYEYVFPVGDKTLLVTYRVYGSDPRNHIETVDAIVQSIQVKK